MKALLEVHGRRLAVQLQHGHDLAVHVAFDAAAGIEAFSLPKAVRAPVAAGSFVGDTRRGGSCNCETLTITPHGDGTHTEGVGHLLDARVPVTSLCDSGLLLARVVTVAPVRLGDVADTVVGHRDDDDRVIAAGPLARALDATPFDVTLPIDALVVRTPGGAAAKRTMRWSGTNPPYLTVDAGRLLRARGVDHVLVELPSLDREDDGGHLGAHRAFFDVPQGARAIEGAPPRRTVTELVVVPDDVKDGLYALSLQLAPLTTDAVPSRPLLFPVTGSA